MAWTGWRRQPNAWLLLPMLIAGWLAVPAIAATPEPDRGMQRVFDAGGRELLLYRESHALVIGMSAYRNGWPPLAGVRDDVAAVRQALEATGFLVETRVDLDRNGLEAAFRDFINRYGQAPDSRLLFYYAGHGHTMTLSYGGQMGYLVPVDAPDPNRDANGFHAVALSMEEVEVFARRIQAKHALFVFDSCFSGSIFEATRAIPDAIQEKTSRPVRQFITSGTAEQTVPDNSIFRRQFVAAITGQVKAGAANGYLTAAELGFFLEAAVTNYSRRSQTPQYGKLRDPNLDKGDFVFLLPGAAGTTPAAGAPAVAAGQPQAGGGDAVEMAFWDAIKSSTNPADYAAYLQTFPNGHFVALAKVRAAAARPPSAAPPPVAAPALPMPTPPAPPLGPVANQPGSQKEPDRSEQLFWQSILASERPEDFEAYLQQFPVGDFAPLARNRLAELRAARSVMPVPAAPVRPVPPPEPVRLPPADDTGYPEPYRHITSTTIPCTDGMPPVEVLICTDPRLSRADGVMGHLYKDLRGGLSSGDARALRDDQRAWLKRRDRDCPVTDRDLRSTTTAAARAECMTQATNRRISELWQRYHR